MDSLHAQSSVHMFLWCVARVQPNSCTAALADARVNVPTVGLYRGSSTTAVHVNA